MDDVEELKQVKFKLQQKEHGEGTFITVAPSFVIVCLPFASTSNKSPPYGPSVLRIVA